MRSVALSTDAFAASHSFLRGFAMLSGSRCPRSLRLLAPALLALALLSGVGARAAWAQASFGLVAVGSASSSTVTVTASTAGTVAGVKILTQGAAGLDYAAGTGSSTCAGASLDVGQTCTQQVSFTPSVPGVRMGAVVLVSAGGAALGTAYLSGTGSGSLGVLVAGNLIPVAGSGNWTLVLDGDPATSADLNLPSSMTLDGAGNLYIADSIHNRIRKVDAATGTMATIAGDGNATFTGDGGPAAAATLNTPSGVALDGAGNLYIADAGNHAIRVIDAATGWIRTVAGSAVGTAGSSGDGGAATAALLNNPLGVTVDAGGNLYIADTGNHRIRRVSAGTGIMTNVAGNGLTNADGSGGYAGDGGPATAAELNHPYAVAFDAAGNLYIPDAANARVRRVDPGGIVTTFAGTGIIGYSGDGAAATAATLWSPSGVAVDAAGNVYIADTQNNAIRKVNAVSGEIATVARDQQGEFYLGGSFGPVSLYGPTGLYLDGKGNLYIADYFNMRIRELEGNLTAVDLTQTPVRQGDLSTVQAEAVENDGNLPLDLTAMTPDANAAVNSGGTSCVLGAPYLAVAAQCVVGAEFAPSVSGDPVEGNVDVASQTANTPLDIKLIGDATPVNSTTIVLTSSVNPTQYGALAGFTATVTTGQGTGNLTGTVTFFDGAKSMATAVALNTSGAAVFSTTALTVGSHSITASYSGDKTHFASTSNTVNQVVNEGTAMGLASSRNPSALGDAVTFTATVSVPGGGGVVPTGAVSFYNGAALMGSSSLTSAGEAKYTIASLSNGLHPITATFNADEGTYVLGSSSTVLEQDVAAETATTVTSAPNPSNFGQQVTLTATVQTTGTGTPTGQVNFLDGGRTLGSGILAGTQGATASATFTTPALSAGTHAITAGYLGDTENAVSTSAPVTQTVNRSATTTAVTAQPMPGIAGRPVALTATVQLATGVGAITGTVTFTDGTTQLGTATVGGGGMATLNATFAPGDHAIAASYGGDANNGASASSPLALTVVQATTQTILTSSQPAAVVLASVSFTAHVTGNGGTPTGQVSFAADGKAVGTGTLDATGTATLSLSTLGVGSHAMTAAYAGDMDDAPSSSAAVTQTVGPIPTVTGLGVGSNGAGSTPQVILVASVIGASGPVPTGAVAFASGATTLVQVALDESGVATLTPDLAPGTYTITARYAGDLLHDSSASTAVKVSAPGTGFGLTVTPGTVTVATTRNVTVSVELSSISGFADTIGLGCAALPPGVTCHFASPTADLKANGGTSVQLTIDTNNPLSGGTTASSNGPSTVRGASAALAGLCFPVGLALGWLVWRTRRRVLAGWALLLALGLAGTALGTGCNGFTQTSAAPGSYVIEVTGVGTQSNMTHYQSLNLTITK